MASFSSPWPDPDSPVLSKIDFGVPLVELFKWLDVRDTFLGQNERKQNITKALELARDCKHPDAEWLISIFEGKEVSTKEGAREVFLLHENDARALCFSGWLSNNRRIDFSDVIRRAAEMGNAFARSSFSMVALRDLGDDNIVLKELAFRFAQLAAAQHERDGFRVLGCFLDVGTGCGKDLNLARENLLIAAELGHIYAAERYGDLLDESDPARWIWLGRAALRGQPNSFLDSFANQVKRFFSGSGAAPIMFLIGRVLEGNIDMEKKEIFGSSLWNFDSVIGPANQAVSFYFSQIKSARLGVDTWTVIGTRNGIVKDVRKLIGKIIWDARFVANYKD